MKSLKDIKFPKITVFSKIGDKIKSVAANIKERAHKTMSSDEMTSLSVKLWLQNSKEQLIRLGIILAVVVVVGGLFIYSRVRVFHRYKVLSVVERSDDAITEYVNVKGNRTLKCNPNGVTCVNAKNEVQWNTTFNMQSLIIDQCESTVVVGDQRGSDIYVFNQDGLLGSYEVEHTLTKVRVARQGVVAAVLEDGETTWINMYDLGGNILVTNRTSMKESGYPVDMDLSADGLKMVVSFLGITSSDIRDNVSFYNFSSVGQGQNNNLVNNVEYIGHVVAETRFLDKTHAIAFRDDGITFFSGKQVPEEKHRIDIDGEIISTFCNDSYVGIVTLSDEEEKTHKYKMQTYRVNGTKSMTKYFDFPYTGIKMEEDEIVMFNNREMQIYTRSGKLKFSGDYDKQILDVLKTADSRTYTVVTSEGTERIKIK